MMGWHGGMMWTVLFGVLLLVAFSAVVTGAVLVALRARTDSDSSREQSAALRLLDERLARGEIDVEEYRRARELLSGSR